MQKKLLRKSLVIGIVVLFIGVSVSSANTNVVIKNLINDDQLPNDPDIETFYPTDDAIISQNTPDLSYGDNIFINVRNDEGSGQAYWVLIKFDISSIPSNAIVLSATLNCYYVEWHGIDNPYNDRLEIYRLTSDWNEETVTWNKRPINTPEPTMFTNVPSSPGSWMQWDVTEDVKNFVSGNFTNYGWKISDETYHDWASIIRFCSKEYGSFTPYLEIEFTRSRNKDCGCNEISDADSVKVERLLDRVKVYSKLLLVLSKHNTELKEISEELLNEIKILNNKVNGNFVYCLLLLIKIYTVGRISIYLDIISCELTEDSPLYKIFCTLWIYFDNKFSELIDCGKDYDCWWWEPDPHP